MLTPAGLMQHERVISVTGLGYVGIQVACAFARRGCRVVAFDVDVARISDLRDGRDRTGEADAADLALPFLHFTADSRDLSAADFHIVCVPTPLTELRKPDLRPLLAAARSLGASLRRGAIVVFESTVYPGATEEECIPELERASGLICGEDFDVGYSPERINPGDRQHRLETVVKVIAARNAETLAIIRAVYGSVIDAGLHEAPDVRTAEAAKAIENTQRDLNIALMNELAMICGRLGIDTRDVLAAAATKWNFLPFSPGLVGGHCVGVDPYYLTDRAEREGYHPEVILAGRRINHGMGAWIAQETIKRLLRTRPAGAGAGDIVVLGVTFKEDVPDCRNSRVPELVEELQALGARVQLADPAAEPADVQATYGLRLIPAAQLRPGGAVVLAVPHQAYRAAGWPLIRSLLTNGVGFVTDVRACLDREGAPPGIHLWRP